MEILSSDRAFGGTQLVLKHASRSCACDMTFAVYVPPVAEARPVPLLWYLSGLTCTHENAMVKAGAQRAAARHGLAVCFPDTSPRGDGVADAESFDLGQGAGFYVDATETPWAPHYAMWSYLTDELPRLLVADFPVSADRQAITGHSMGGHGALTLAMAGPRRFASVSAFAPIAHPTASDWGRPQFTAYLGADETGWARHDATLLMRERGFDGPVLVDQGAKDGFLDRLMPEHLAEAMIARRQPGAFRMHEGHGHSYFFVSTFMEDHVAFHAEALGL